MHWSVMVPVNKVHINCTINGQTRILEVFPMTRLLDTLRAECNLTGTKEGCGEGECGACGVLIDGKLINSCLVPISQIRNKRITTIEGLSGHPASHAVQEAFLRYGGAQCGICTPGMIMASVNLLEKHPNPTESQIRQHLSGNLCRCTGYSKIIESVVKALSLRGATT